MTDDKKKQMIDRVKKLLAMADRKDGNENEAAVASAQAAKLLSKYNLSLGDVSVEEIIDAEFETTQKTPPQWVSVLAQATSKSFGCDMFLKSKARDGKRVTVITFMGSEVDIQIVQYVTSYLRGVVNKMAVEYGKTLRPEQRRLGRKSYRLGLISTIEDKLNRLNKRQNEEMKDETNEAGLTGTEIVHIKKDMLEKHMDKKGFKKVRESSVGIGLSHYGQGETDGKKVDIHSGISSEGNRKELTG
jgi:hypothetical protein